MKDIHEYLAYYIGQPCQTDQGSGTIEGVNDTDSCGGTWAVRIGEDYEMFTENDCEWVKPILRRLSDMTEQEALHIGKLAFFDSDMKYPDSDYTVKKTGITIELPSAYAVSINNDWYEREIRIGFNTGNIWNRPDQHIYERIYNQPQIFHYLLKQGFDLFGLIDAGLAIDAKTIQTPSK